MKGEVIAHFEDKFGDRREIYQESPRGALKVKKLKDTVSHKMNRVAAVLIGQRIKERRIRAGMTLEELCEKSGLVSQKPKNRMWEIENAIRQEGVRLGTLFAIAYALGCEARDLLPSVSDVTAKSEVAPRTALRLVVMGPS